jgi:hypothetical protein
MDEPPQVPTERIFHETKFVFLSCAEVAHGSVVYTTLDVTLQEAYGKELEEDRKRVQAKFLTITLRLVAVQAHSA